MKEFGGPVLFLDRSNINTDEIIPAKYLTEVKKESLKPYLLEDLALSGFDPKGETLRNAKVIVSRENFGCGSSREHAPWALEVNEITVVIACSFARIFRQNMYNCGMMALELPEADIAKLFALKGSSVECQVDMSNNQLTFGSDSGEELNITFSLGEFECALVEAGGWVEFADARY